MKKIILVTVFILILQPNLSWGAVLLPQQSTQNQANPWDNLPDTITTNIADDEELPLLPDSSGVPTVGEQEIKGVPVESRFDMFDFNIGKTGFNALGYNPNKQSDSDFNSNSNNKDILDQIVNFSGMSNPVNKVLNQLYYVGLIIAVILAIIMIIRGGLEYMTIDAAASKETGKRRVQAALGGLLLAFSAILILRTINPKLTDFTIKFNNIEKVKADQSATPPSSSPSYSPVPPYSGQPNLTLPGEEGTAFMSDFNNAGLARASANGTITVNGHTYSFISGGGGNGYLPPGEYTVSNGRYRSDKSGMIVDGVGYSFDLNDTYDSRVGAERTELRIHPDGGNPGTAGCIGIQGNGGTQQRFYDDMNTAIRNGGGTYKIKVGK